MGSWGARQGPQAQPTGRTVGTGWLARRRTVLRVTFASTKSTGSCLFFSSSFQREESSFAWAGGAGEEGKQRPGVHGFRHETILRARLCVLSVCPAAAPESLLGTCLPDLTGFDLCFLSKGPHHLSRRSAVLGGPLCPDVLVPRQLWLPRAFSRHDTWPSASAFPVVFSASLLPTCWARLAPIVPTEPGQDPPPLARVPQSMLEDGPGPAASPHTRLRDRDVLFAADLTACSPASLS